MDTDCISDQHKLPVCPLH